MIDVTGRAVDLAGVDHDRARAGFHRRGKRRQEILAQVVFRNPRWRAIASGERKTVAHVMLQTRRDLCLRTDVAAFETTRKRDAHHFREVRIFAKGFVKTRPQWIASEIEHGREAPRYPGGARFGSTDLRRALHQFGVPRRRHSDLLWK